MADKNLHDIKIDDLDNPKKTPLKNILTLLALLFIILVISVAITRLILNTDDEVSSDNNESSTATVVEAEGDPEADKSLTGATAGVAAAAVAGSMLANGTPLKERNISKNTNTQSDIKESKKDDEAIKEKDSGSKTKVTLRERQPVKPKEVAVVTPKKHVAHVVKKRPTHNDKQSVDKVVSSNKQPASHSTHSTEGKKRAGHYIKVGTFKDTSTAIAKIKKTGLNYILVKPKNDKTMTRVLIGPFKSNWGAKQHLPSVQNNIAEGAYITRID